MEVFVVLAILINAFVGVDGGCLSTAHYEGAKSGTNDDDLSTSTCPNGNQVMTGCTVRNPWMNPDGSKPGGHNLCLSYNGYGGSGVYAVATCLTAAGIGSSNFQHLEGQRSGTNYHDTSSVTCNSGYTLTGCSCYSPWRSCDAAKGSGNSCTAWHRGFHYIVGSSYLVVTDSGSGADWNLYIWHPHVQAGYYSVGAGATNNGWTPPLLQVRGEYGIDVIRPSDFSKRWDDAGSGANSDFSFWVPICPANFVPMGAWAHAGHHKPSTGVMHCVHYHFARQVSMGGIIWGDWGSGANSDGSAWLINSGLGAYMASFNWGYGTPGEAVYEPWGDGGLGVYAEAVCVILPEHSASDVAMITGGLSGNWDDAASTATCPPWATLTGCECNSPYGSCDGSSPSGNTCYSYNEAGGFGVYAEAICIRTCVNCIARPVIDDECCEISDPCAHGKGDCDDDSGCAGGMVCGRDNCILYNPGQDRFFDCCINTWDCQQPSANNCPLPPPSRSHGFTNDQLTSVCSDRPSAQMWPGDFGILSCAAEYIVTYPDLTVAAEHQFSCLEDGSWDYIPTCEKIFTSALIETGRAFIGTFTKTPFTEFVAYNVYVNEILEEFVNEPNVVKKVLNKRIVGPNLEGVMVGQSIISSLRGGTPYEYAVQRLCQGCDSNSGDMVWTSTVTHCGCLEPASPDLSNIFLYDSCYNIDTAQRGVTYYYRVEKDQDRTWIEAEKECIDAGGHLPSVHSAEELSFLADIVNETWIGINTDVEPLCQLFTDGTGTDSLSIPCGSAGTCVNFDRGSMAAQQCTDKRHFICQIDRKKYDVTTTALDYFGAGEECALRNGHVSDVHTNLELGQLVSLLAGLGSSQAFVGDIVPHTTNVCTRPAAWCTGTAHFTQYDCDGDMILDNICYDIRSGNYQPRGLMLSTQGCAHMWPNVRPEQCPDIFLQECPYLVIVLKIADNSEAGGDALQIAVTNAQGASVNVDTTSALAQGIYYTSNTALACSFGDIVSVTLGATGVDDTHVEYVYVSYNDKHYRNDDCNCCMSTEAESGCTFYSTKELVLKQIGCKAVDVSTGLIAPVSCDDPIPSVCLIPRTYDEPNIIAPRACSVAGDYGSFVITQDIKGSLFGVFSGGRPNFWGTVVLSACRGYLVFPDDAEYTFSTTSDGCTLFLSNAATFRKLSCLPSGCESGIPSDGGLVCCAAGCGTCGGSGCDTRPGGTANCCVSTISANGANGLSCDTNPPPCVLYTVAVTPLESRISIIEMDICAAAQFTVSVFDSSSNLIESKAIDFTPASTCGTESWVLSPQPGTVDYARTVLFTPLNSQIEDVRLRGFEYPVFHGVDFGGGDVTTITNVAGHHKCSELCSKTTICQEWTWLSAGLECFLKSGRLETTYSPTAISGIPMSECRYEYFIHSTFEGAVGGVPYYTVEAAKHACDIDWTCSGISKLPSDAYWTLRSATKLIEKTQAESEQKLCEHSHPVIQPFTSAISSSYTNVDITDAITLTDLNDNTFGWTVTTFPSTGIFDFGRERIISKIQLLGTMTAFEIYYKDYKAAQWDQFTNPVSSLCQTSGAAFSCVDPPVAVSLYISFDSVIATSVKLVITGGGLPVVLQQIMAFGSGGYTRHVMRNNDNGRCSAVCRTDFPNEIILYAATQGMECYCSTVQTPQKPAIIGSCDLECTADSLQFCGSSGFEGQDVVSVFRANTYELLGFLPSLRVGTRSLEVEFAGPPRYVNYVQLEDCSISLSFRDSSTGEERYEYSRPNSPNAKWRNLMNYNLELTTRTQCGYDYQDIILKERVGVSNSETFIQAGEEHKFILRWNSDYDGAQKYIEDSEVSFLLKAMWSCHLCGKVRSASGIGVEGVRIQAIMNGEFYETFTTVTGVFDILIQQYVPGDVQHLTVYFYYKSTNDVVHEFECPGGTKCTEYAHKLRHECTLTDFEKQQQVLFIEDITVLSVTGKVYVSPPYPPGYENYYRNDANLCGIPEVLVCPDYIGSEKQADCVETDANGIYALVVEYGSNVRIYVKYPGHVVTSRSGDDYTFMAIDNDKSGADFFDETETHVYIEVVGGTTACDSNILNWVIEVKPVKCYEVLNTHFKLFGNGAPSNTFILGAQEFELQLIGNNEGDVTDVVSTPIDNLGVFQSDPIQVEQYFVQQEKTPRIDLTDQVQGTVEDVRFEYHIVATPTLTVRKVGSNIDVPHCVATGKDYHVTEKLEVYNLTVTYQENYYTKNGGFPSYCGDVSGRLTLQEIPENVKVEGTTENVVTNPTTSFLFTTLAPRGLPYQITLNFRSDQGIYSKYVFQTQVTGILALAGFLSMPLPRGDPAYILRDPPGDGSFAKYAADNSIAISFSTAKGTGTHDDYYTDIYGGLDAETDLSFDAGFGLGAIVTSGIGFNGLHVVLTGGTIDSDYSTDKKTNDASINWEVTASESFATSDDDRMPGEKSDMFLIPALNIEMGLSILYEYVSDCTLDDHEVTTWSIPPNADDADMFAWISQYHIEAVEIPLLERELLNFTSITCTCPYNSGPIPDCEKKCQVVAGLESWNKTLEMNTRLKTANYSKLDTRVNNRLDDWANFDDASNFKKDVTDYKSDIGASKTHSIDLDTHVFVDVDDMLSNDPLEKQIDKVNMIFFSGGGSSQTYTYSSERAASVNYIVDWEEETTDDSHFDRGENVLGLTIFREETWGDGDVKEQESSAGRSRSSTITTSFTLTDDDYGDDFTVAVYEDMNGWIFYDLISGSSSCPHEGDTVNRVLWEYSVDQTINLQQVSVFEDETVHWRLLLRNAVVDYRDIILSNVVPLTFYPIRNHQGVTLLLNGLPFSHDTDIYPAPKEIIHQDLSATRPPGTVYDFNFTVCIYLSCWPWDTQDFDFQVHFIQHCPIAEFRFKNVQLITTKLVGSVKPYVWNIEAKNPNWRLEPWPDTDILKIRLKFRVVNLFGVSRWQNAAPTFDFAKNLTQGYSEYPWDITNYDDGDYDLHYYSKCTVDPQKTNYGELDSLSAILPIIIDFAPPYILKFPEPQDAIWQLGDEVSFQFNEPITCDYVAKLYIHGQNLPVKSSTDETLDTVCFNNGADGKIFFDVNEYIAREGKVGEVYEAVILSVEDLHDNTMEAQELSSWQFVVSEKRTDISIYTALYDAKIRCDLNVTEVAASTGDLTVNVDGVYTVQDNAQDCNSHPTYINQANGYILSYVTDFGTKGWVFGNVSCIPLFERDYTGGYKIAEDQTAQTLDGIWKLYDGVGVQVLLYSDVNLTLECIAGSGNSLLSLDDDSTFHTTWGQQMSHLLGISEDRIQIQEITQPVPGEDEHLNQATILLEESSPQLSKISFSVLPKRSHHHIDELPHEEAGKVLLEALQSEFVRDDYPNLYLTDISADLLQYQVVQSHEPECSVNPHEPFLIVSRSGFHDDDTFSLYVNTSIQYRDISFYFEDATNLLGKFILSSNTVPSKSHHWKFDVEDQCWRIFHFQMNWDELSEDEIGVELASEGVHEGTLIVDISGVAEYKLPFHVYPELGAVHGTACGPVVDISNGGDMSHCEGTLSGRSCDVRCAPKFMPLEPSIECNDGQWTSAECYETIFSTSRGPVHDIWRLCGESEGHLLSIHSTSDNNAAKELCRESLKNVEDLESHARECYIGLFRDEETKEFSWIDSTELDFTNWAPREPSNFRGHLETVVVIHADTGMWSDRGYGEQILPGLCMTGLCIDSPTLSFVSPPGDIEIEVCDPVPEAQEVYVSSGCVQWPTEHIHEDRNDYAITRTWAYAVGKIPMEHTQIIQRVDSPPTLTNVGPEVITLFCGDEVPSPDNVTASDPCDGDLEVNFEETRLAVTSDTCPYTISRKWVATDGNGNKSQFQQMINFELNQTDDQQIMDLLQELMGKLQNRN